VPALYVPLLPEVTSWNSDAYCDDYAAA